MNSTSRILLIACTGALFTLGFCLLLPTHKATVHAQTTLGGPIPNLTNLETRLFNHGFVEFNKVWDPQQGLGPVFNEDQCSLCHHDPVVGGNSTQKITFFGKFNSDGTFNYLTDEGGYYLQSQSVQKFKPACQLNGEHLPADATIIALHQSPQTFGSGLIDNVSDTDILAQAIDKGMGVHGVANMVLDENGNLRPGRFGYKDEFADLLQTDASEFQRELGITNPIFPNEDLPQGQPIPPNCANPVEPNDDGTNTLALYHYNLYLAPNIPGAGNSNGQALFSSIGCALCHLPSYSTMSKVFVPVTYKGRFIESKALENQAVNLYSDLLLHDMGGALADGFELGLATGAQFRTMPLWGLSTRIADGDGLMHDGSAKDLPSAIARHGGEATQVINNFNALSASDQADVIAFISSL